MNFLQLEGNNELSLSYWNHAGVSFPIQCCTLFWTNTWLLSIKSGAAENTHVHVKFLLPHSLPWHVIYDVISPYTDSKWQQWNHHKSTRFNWTLRVTRFQIHSCFSVTALQVQWLPSKRRPRAAKEPLRPVPKGQGQRRQTQRCAHPQHTTGQQSTWACSCSVCFICA